MARDSFVIAQLSDLHCGSPFFDGDLLETAVKETIALGPDLVMIGGDLTAEGYAHEFRDAAQYIQPLFDAGLTTIVIPGNHDSKNVGYVHFHDLFGLGELPGKGDRQMLLEGGRHGGPHGDRPMKVRIVAMDSTKPDLAEGEIGRERYGWLRDQYDGTADVRLFALHHHLVPVPGTGRERNTVWDAGDVLTLLHELDVHLVLSGHKHVPHVWLLNGVLVVNSGTVSSYRLRGYTRPSYNILEIDDAEIRVTLKYPGTGEKLGAVLHRELRHLTTSAELAGMFEKERWGM